MSESVVICLDLTTNPSSASLSSRSIQRISEDSKFEDVRYDADRPPISSLPLEHIFLFSIFRFVLLPVHLVIMNQRTETKSSQSLRVELDFTLSSIDRVLAI